jgi:hypothetical protein
MDTLNKTLSGKKEAGLNCATNAVDSPYTSILQSSVQQCKTLFSFLYSPYVYKKKEDNSQSPDWYPTSF